MLIKNEKTGVVFVVPKINVITKVGKKFVAGTDIGIFSLNIDVEHGYVETVYDEVLNSYVFTPSKIPIKHEKFLGIIQFNLDEVMKKFQKRINVTSILQVDENKVLIGTKDGLVFVNLLNKKYKIYYPINKHVTILTKDDQSKIWVGTKGGVSIYYVIEEGLKLIRHLTIHSKLPGQDIRVILPTKNKVLIGTNEGVCEIINQLLVVFEEKYDVTGGCIAPDESIWFSTKDGNLLRFNKEGKIEIFKLEKIKNIDALVSTPRSIVASGDSIEKKDVLIEIIPPEVQVHIYLPPINIIDIRALYYDKDDDILIIGTYAFGIFVKKDNRICGEDFLHLLFNR
jgi:hypothetical protein